MSYFPTYSYSSSSGWTLGPQAGPSSSLSVVDEWSHLDPSNFFPTDYSDPSTPFPADYSNNSLHPYYRDIPISKYSTLAGALDPVNSNPQEDEIRPLPPISQPAPQPAPQPVLQQVQLQLFQPVSSQPAGPALLQPAQPGFTQPAQPTNSQSVAPTHLGAQSQNVAPPPAITTQRRAYVFVNPPARNRRQPVGTPQYCKVDGCKRWTTERGKELARHRATHFPGRVGIACPSCGVVFSRSGVCGKHLKKCDPQCWGDRKAKKGTQDAWGIRVGQDLIKRSLVDGEYTPQVKYRL